MRPASRARRALFELARLHGVQTSFTAADGSRRSAGDEPVLAVLAALGVPLSGCFDAPEALRAEHNVRATQLIEPVLVSRTGARSRHCLRPPPRFEPDSAWIEVAAEDGSVTRRRLGQVLGPASSFAHQREPGGYLELRLGPDLCPHDGYYRLRVETTTSIAEALVISAPPRCPQPAPGWGVFAPVHALSSRGDWGIGTFHDLGALGSVVQRLGGSFVATLPIFAAFLDGPAPEPSPYRPASRLAWNEVYLDLSRLEELEASPQARAAMDDRATLLSAARLRRRPLSDPPAVMALKRSVLEPAARACFSSPRRAAALESWLAKRPEVAAYARFRALRARGGSLPDAGPRAGPRTDKRAKRGQAGRDQAGRDRTGRDRDEAERYHLYVQWVAEMQLSSAHSRCGLYLDLPVGVHPDGFDPWWDPASFIPDVSGGAPPDAFFSDGQNWGMAPLHPEGIRKGGYHYLIATLRHAMRHADVVRLDHVMSLHRLYVIPRGFDTGEGLYVRYRADELRAVVVLEALRAGVAVVGEDLGTVPATVRRDMGKDGMLRSYVWQFAATPVAPLPDPPQQAVASLGTHDLLPFAGFLDPKPLLNPAGASSRTDGGGEDQKRRIAIRSALGAGPSDASIRGAMRRCTLHLARSKARLVLVDAADLLLAKEPQNTPGSTRPEDHFRRRLAGGGEALTSAGVSRLLSEVNRARRVAPAPGDRGER